MAGGSVLARRFGENLIRARSLAKMSQEELGYRASLHRTEISQLERGLRVPRLDTVLKLSASLEPLADPLGELLRGMKWEPGSVHLGSFNVSEGE